MAKKRAAAANVPRPTSDLLSGVPRPSPYFWVTWLCGLLSGDKSCLWAAWFRGHYKDYAKVPESANLIKWTQDHDAMVSRRVNDMRANGWTVYVEDQNKFTLKGETAVVGGKPDMLAIKGTEALVIDAKSGRPKEADAWQVRIYLMALRQTHAAILPAMSLSGELDYAKADPRIILSDELTSAVLNQIGTLIRRVAAAEPPGPRMPTASECRYCDLADCPDRMADPVPVKTRMF